VPPVSNDRVSRAVKACLHHCMIATSPLAALAEFAAMLRTDPDWGPEEIDAVERGVRKMLRAIINPSDSGIIPPFGEPRL
jgi:hypothetical protein